MYYLIKNVRLISKKDFEEAIEEGKKKGHTHCQIMRIGYCDRFLSFDSVAFENISNNLEGHGVYAVRTGYPVYSNRNKFRYDPYVSGVTEKKQTQMKNVDKI